VAASGEEPAGGSCARWNQVRDMFTWEGKDPRSIGHVAGHCVENGRDRVEYTPVHLSRVRRTSTH
jgi:hypothetical protein